MTNKFLFKQGALWRKCLAYVKHMLSIFWTSIQPQRKVSVTSALFGTRRDADFQLAQKGHTKATRSPLMLRKIAAMFLLLFTFGIGNAWATVDSIYYAVTNKPSNTKNVTGDGKWMSSAGMHNANASGVYWSVSTNNTPSKVTDITNTEYTSKTVKQIVVTGRRNREESFTIDATVGGNAFGSQYVSTASSSDYTYTATFTYSTGATGNIVLTLTSQGGGSIWVSSITVTYEGVVLHDGASGATTQTITIGDDFPSDVTEVPGWVFYGEWVPSANADDSGFPGGTHYSPGDDAPAGTFYALYLGNITGCNDGDYSCKPTPTYAVSLTNPSSGSGVDRVVVSGEACGPEGEQITLIYYLEGGGTYMGANITRDDNGAAVDYIHDDEEQTITFELPASDVTVSVNFECPDLTGTTVTINPITPYYDLTDGKWKVRLTWQAMDGATRYGYQVKDKTANIDNFVAPALTTNTYLDVPILGGSDLTAGHEYSLHVKANNPCDGNSPSTNVTDDVYEHFKTECPALTGTLAISINDIGATSASISWGGVFSPEVQTNSGTNTSVTYDVQITKSGEATGGVLDETDWDYTEWSSSSLTSGATYTIEVTAKNVCGATQTTSTTFKPKNYDGYTFSCADLNVETKLVTANTPIFITSTAGKTVRSQDSIRISGSGLTPSTTLTYPGLSSKFSVKTRTGANLSTDGSGAIDTYAYIYYTPDGGDTSDDLDKLVGLTVEVGGSKRRQATLTQDIIGRHLPSQFVVAGKKNNKWYAMPANMASTTNPKPSEIAVDDINNPSIAYTADSTIYSLEGPTASNISGSNGQYIRFVMMPLWADDSDHSKGHAPLFGSATGTRTIGKSGTSQATSDLNSGGWWWKLVQTNTSVTNPQDAKYTIYAANNSSSLSLRDNAGNPDWGLFASGVSELRLIPASNIPFAEAYFVEWGQHGGVLEVDATGIDATSVVAHLNGASSAAITLSQTRTSVKSGATKYNYTVSFGDVIDFAAAASNGAMLTLEWKNGETVKAMSNIVVPKIIASSSDMKTLMSGDAQWETEVHVLPGVMLTANGGSFESSDVRINQLEIYQGATVKVTTGTLNVASLVLRNGWTRVGEKAYDVARLYVATTANLTKANLTDGWYSDWYIDYDQYYPIAVPFPVATSSISYKNTKSTTTAGVKIRYYDGARRAEHEQQNQDENWVLYNWDGTTPAMPANLEPSKGYAMTAKRPSGKAFSIVRMPMTFTKPWTALGEHGYVDETHKDQVMVTGWGKGTTPWYAMGWNFIGNPYMCTFNGNDGGISGKIEMQNGGSVKYATIPDLEFKNFYQVPIAEANLKPASGFFIQANNADPQTITFNASKIVPPSAPTRYTTTEVTIPEQEAYIRLSNGEEKDMMGLIIGEDYTEAYEPNADLAKILGDANTVKTYMNYSDMNLAYVAINETLAKNWIPVTVKIPATGEYTFSLSNFSTVDALEGIYLIDHANGDKVTNLIEEDYTFSEVAGTNSERFALNAIVGERQTPTDVDATNGGTIDPDKAIKFMYREKVYILYHGEIYDSTGKKVK